MNQTADIRAKTIYDRGSELVDNEAAIARAQKAWQAYQGARVRIAQQAAGKNLAVIRAEVSAAEQLYRREMNASLGMVSGGGTRGGRSGRASAMLFQGQQAIEDYSYAGFRGLSNNLAFMGSMMGGPAGIAVVAGVAAKGVYDLYQSFKQAGSGAGEMATQIEMASTRLERFAQARQQFRQEALDFSVPTNRRELDQRDADLKFRRQRAGNTAGLEADEKNLALLQQMKKLRESATESYWWKGMGSWAPGPVVDKFVSKMSRFEDLKRQLSDPGVAADPDKIGDEIGKIQQRIAARKDEIATERDSIAMEERRLINNLHVVDALENAARKQDRLTTGLERQLDIERQLVEATKRRAESIQDAAYGRGDAFGGRAFDAQGSILARQWQQRTERAQHNDRVTQTHAFRKMFGADPSNHALGGRFNDWLSRRHDAIGKQGEQLEEKAQFDLAKQRADMLKARGEEQLAQANRFAERGNIGRAADFFDRARGSFSSVQDMQLQWASRGTDPMKQQKFLDEAKATEGWIGGIDKAELAANEKAAAGAQGKIGVLESMSKSVEELAARAERLTIFKEADMAKARSLNGELDGMIQRLERIQGLSAGAAGGAGAGGGRGLPGRAQGGPVSRNSPYVVGERGMELFIPTVPGQVVNATDTRRMLSAARQAVAPVTSTTSNVSTSFSIGSINAATVDVAEIQRQADWRKKAMKARRGF
ncbi:hypothetical protein Pan44_47590 [Caulifigura coniformis]|uniref:Uncharacterized protein n=1 Tax=Caulifigura coniformis TaxID=2527983 RepID=A0A517SKP8_9PLAN|nr:hypothetical protein [Caulifigura coniformis]QDT56702.1 hypothetical protein Pan44_47590 [Caulifigura coniformis]